MGCEAPKLYLMTSYVEERDGGYYLSGSRVSLDSIVHEFRNGSSAETIQQEFVTLTLEQVYGGNRVLPRTSSAG